MIEAWGADDVRAAEAALMAELPDGELMARAAEGLTQVALARLTERGGSAVVALVGPGNNGGDTLYAAAHLADRGFAVAAVRADWPVHEGGLARAQASGVIVTDPGGQQWKQLLAEADLVLDGILGIGGRPGLPAQAIAWVEAIPDDAYVLAVDLPSGQDPAGEAATPDAVFADETVTFGVPKPVHLLPATEPPWAASPWSTSASPSIAPRGAAGHPRRRPAAVAGAVRRGRQVLPRGPGHRRRRGAVHRRCPAVHHRRGLQRRRHGPLRRHRDPDGARALRRAGGRDRHRPGPGVGGRPGLDVAATGHGARQLEAARAALGSDLPVLVDAGGLDLIERPRQAPTLLTPHAGELARLISRLTGEEVSRQDVAASPVAHARRAADVTGATVLLKGSTTLVVAPTGRGLPVRSQNDAPAWLATAGAGDVLAGLAGTLLAAGLAPMDAGSLAALVHGWRPIRPTRAARCARSPWPTAYRALWLGC